MNRRLLYLLLMTASLLGAAYGAESGQLILVRAACGSGGYGQSSQIELSSITTPSYTASAPGSSLLNIYPDFLAPASDSAGLVTRVRIQRILLGQDTTRDPVAIDFGGNRDGRVDIADLVSRTNRRLP
jgi:hypothetical protein